MNNTLGCIIVTYNPDEQRFEKVLDSISKQCDKILIIDNNSSNLKYIKKICEVDSRIKLTQLEKNYGIARALNIGINLLNRDPFDWILTLDQDSIVLGNILDVLDNARVIYKNTNIGLISLNTQDTRCKDYFSETQYPIISGSIINSDIFKKGLRYREEFFMDQVDFDFDIKISSLGYKMIATSIRMLDHQMGIKTLGMKKQIEPDWRLYLISRNSFILLREKKISLMMFIGQLMLWFINDLSNGKSLPKLYKYFIIYLFGIKDGAFHYMEFPENNKSLKKIKSLLSNV